MHDKTFGIRYFNLMFSTTADANENTSRGTHVNHKRVSGEHYILYIWFKLLHNHYRQAAVIKNILVLTEHYWGVLF